MTRAQKKKAQAAEWRRQADRYEESVSSSAGPSSQEWVSPERREHYMGMAAKLRLDADKLERGK